MKANLKPFKKIHVNYHDYGSCKLPIKQILYQELNLLYNSQISDIDRP